MAHGLHPHKMTIRKWKNIQADIVLRHGHKYMLSYALKRDMGWTARFDPYWPRNGIVYMDFWSSEARTAFLLEYGHRDFD